MIFNRRQVLCGLGAATVAASRAAVAQVQAEFYWLRDQRLEHDLLRDDQKYDDDPERTKRLEHAYQQRLKAAGGALCAAPGGEASIRLRVGELSPVASFRQNAPKYLAHSDRVWLYGFNLCFGAEGDYFDCVSPEWKRAIESVEPGVHEFHPVTLKFNAGVEIERYIFRPTQFDDIVDMARSDADHRGIRPYLKDDPRIVTISRAKTNGKHLIKDVRPYQVPLHRFVSHPLAELLRPLLPRKVDLRSVQLS